MKSDEKKKIYLNFMEGLEDFTENVNLLAQDAKLSNRKDFLERIAYDVHYLYASCIQVLKCHDDDVEEIGSSIQSIFEQPLPIEKKKRITILKAAQEFTKDSALESDLSHIMREYVKYPETTRNFIRELKILTEDLQGIVKAIA